MNDQDAGTAPQKKRRKMTILWIGVAIVAVLVVVPVIIGLLLPQRYQGQTDISQMART